jgi:hypothetical protein
MGNGLLGMKRNAQAEIASAMAWGNFLAEHAETIALGR